MPVECLDTLIVYALTVRLCDFVDRMGWSCDVLESVGKSRGQVSAQLHRASSERPWFEARRRSRTGSSMPPLELKMAGMDEGEDEPAVPLRRSHGIQYIRRFYATKNSLEGQVRADLLHL
jgi:hypothetical protein